MTQALRTGLERAAHEIAVLNEELTLKGCTLEPTFASPPSALHAPYSECAFRSSRPRAEFGEANRRRRWQESVDSDFTSQVVESQVHERA